MLRIFAAFALTAALSFAAYEEPAADDRAADRAAIRADIDGIYRAFIDKDRENVRATHDQNWHGFLEGSREMIRGIEQYMNYVGPMTGPYGMTSYKIRDFDILFQGDAAFVTFVTDIEFKTPSGTGKSVQRLADFYIRKNGRWTQAGSNTSISPEAIADQMQQPQPVSEYTKKSLLEAREAVWRAFFTNDRAALEKLLPAELITIESQGNTFGHRAAVLAGSREFVKNGGKLVRLEFPQTEIQLYGNTAIVYSTYLYEIEMGGRKQSQSGRVTETFVNRNGEWVNPGWHMDSGKL